MNEGFDAAEARAVIQFAEKRTPLRSQRWCDWGSCISPTFGSRQGYDLLERRKRVCLSDLVRSYD